MAKPMTAWAFAECLVEAGVLTQEEVNATSRIVIDVQLNAPVTIYVQRYGDAGALKKLAPMLAGLIRAGEETAQIKPLEGVRSDGD